MSRKELKETAPTSTSSESFFPSYYWNYAKQFMKVGVFFTVAVTGYFLFKRNYGGVASEIENELHSNALVSRDPLSVTQLSVFSSPVNQQPNNPVVNLQHSTVVPPPLVTSEGTTSQNVLDIRYRPKRETETIDKNVKAPTNQQIQLHHKRSVSDEFQVNTYITSDQNFPSVAALPNGNFVVTWVSNGQDGSGQGIYAQLLDVSGNKLGNEFQVNTYTVGTQQHPSVATFPNGNFVVTWEGEGLEDASGIYGQLLDVSGNKLGSEFPVNTYTLDWQWVPSVAVFPNNNFVVTWASRGQDGSTWGSYGQLFNETGNTVGSEFQMNTYTANQQWRPSVSTLPNGKFVVAWTSYGQDASGWGIYGQLFDESGNKTVSEFQANTYTTGDQGFPFIDQRPLSVTAFSNSNFVVTWDSNGQDGSLWGIYGQLLDGSGNKLGSEFPVNAHTANNQNFPSVATFPKGNFVVTWQSDGQDPGDSSTQSGIYGQLLDGLGNKLGSEFPVNTYTTASQGTPSVATLSNGDFVVTWDSVGQDGSGKGIYARIFDLEMNVLNTEIPHSYTEDRNYSFNPNNPIIQPQFYNDPNNATVTVTLTLPDPGAGALTASNVGTARATYNASTGVWQTTGFLGDVNGVFQTVEYRPFLNYNQDFSITILVTDGIGDFTGNVTMNGISINDLSVLMNNTFRLNQGETVIVNNANLGATDVDNDNTLLQFNLINIQNGQFELVANPGNPINTFSQQQITRGDARVVPDDSVNALSYDVTVSDGQNTTLPSSAIIIFNRKPIIENNILSINKNGETVVLTSSNLKVSDVDDPDGSLIITVSNVTRGRFEWVSTPGTEIFSFTQQDILDGGVQFTHDGSNEKPTCDVTVSDGKVNGPTEPTIIFFGPTVVVNSPNAQAKPTSNFVLPVVGAIAGAVGIGVVVGVGFWRQGRNRNTTEYRNEHSFANALRKELQLTGVDDFKSKAGQEFLNTVKQLKTLFGEENYDVENMAAEAIDVFSTYVADAIKRHVTMEKTRFGGQKLDMADVKSKAERIVKSVQKVIRQDGWSPVQGPVTDKYKL